MKLTQRGSVVFGEADAPFRAEYLQHLLRAWRDVTDAARRNLRNLLIVVLVFEALNYARVVDISIAGLTITNLGPVVSIVLVVAAYLTYEMLATAGQWITMRDAYLSYMDAVHPAASDNGWDAPLVPFVAGILTPASPAGDPSDRSLSAKVQRCMGFVVLLAPLAFEAAAYVQMFDTRTRPVGVAIASCVVSALIIVSSYAMAYDDARRRRGLALREPPVST